MRRGDVQRLLFASVATVVLLVPSGMVASAPMSPVAAIATATTHLPQGGTQILGHYRVVAYYGGVDGGALGVLGSKPPRADRRRHHRRGPARGAGYGLPVQPAMELIATVAQGSPGPDGSYSAPISRSALAPYLRVAHRRKMLLILDFQPGRAQFLDQVQAVPLRPHRPVGVRRARPRVEDGPAPDPGHRHRALGRAPINAVRRYLSGIVAARHLPDKLLVVHQFRPEMLPDRQNIHPGPGVEVVFHADGFGTPRAKIATWQRIALPGRPFGTGFKLFLRQDRPMMPPNRVMAAPAETGPDHLPVAQWQLAAIQVPIFWKSPARFCAAFGSMWPLIALWTYWSKSSTADLISGGASAASWSKRATTCC